MEGEVERSVERWAGRKELRALLASLPDAWPACSAATFPQTLLSARGAEGQTAIKKAYALRSSITRTLDTTTIDHILMHSVKFLGESIACDRLVGFGSKRP